MESEFKTARVKGREPMRFLLSGSKFRVGNLISAGKLLTGLLLCYSLMFYSSGCDDGFNPSPEMPMIPVTVELKNAHTEATNIWIEMDGIWEVKSPANLMAPGASRLITDKKVFPDAQNEIVIYGFLDGQTLYSGYSLLTDKYNKLTNVHIYLTITFDGTHFNTEETYTSDD